jgi:hypothetical protein
MVGGSPTQTEEANTFSGVAERMIPTAKESTTLGIRDTQTFPHNGRSCICFSLALGREEAVFFPIILSSLLSFLSLLSLFLGEFLSSSIHFVADDLS